ncbi:MAG TPA: hypothetical protein VMT66_08640 [Steroidobacteraceae bacterium]|nr:hypothetical protein [Steroidobacteraceae bacterium]
MQIARVVPKGVARLRRQLPGILEDAENGLPVLAREVLAGLLEQLHEVDARKTATALVALLVHGARAYLRIVDKKTDAKSEWARRLKERRHVNVAAVALAAKHARISGRSSRMERNIDPRTRRPLQPDVGWTPATTRSRHRGGTTRQELPERTS